MKRNKFDQQQKKHRHISDYYYDQIDEVEIGMTSSKHGREKKCK
jgi:hypothetical protein